MWSTIHELLAYIQTMNSMQSLIISQKNQSDLYAIKDGTNKNMHDQDAKTVD